MAKHHIITINAAVIVGGLMLTAVPAMAQSSIYGDGHDYVYDQSRMPEARQPAWQQEQIDNIRREQQRLKDEIDLRDTLSRSQNPWGPR